MPSEEFRWDAFISYASEDITIASGLERHLSAQGLKIWFDKSILRLGDSVTESISTGLRESRYGIVVLSPNYLRKPWATAEFQALWGEQGIQKRMLPVWHKVSRENVYKFSPLLADVYAIETSQKSLREVAVDIGRVILGRETLSANSVAQGVFDAILAKIKSKKAVNETQLDLIFGALESDSTFRELDRTERIVAHLRIFEGLSFEVISTQLGGIDARAAYYESVRKILEKRTGTKLPIIIDHRNVVSFTGKRDIR